MTLSPEETSEIETRDAPVAHSSVETTADSRWWRLIRLYNGGGGGPPTEPDMSPNPQRELSVLENAGFSIETIEPFSKPWNPAHNMHNAFRGLDPLRAMRVLLTRRKTDIVCAHMESACVRLLLRWIFGFKAPVVIREIPWSPGWAFRERIARLTLPRADRAVVFSSNQIELTRAAYGDQTRVAFIPFCVDLAFYYPQPFSGDTQPYVFSCGLDAGRDFGTLLEASRGLSARVMIKADKSFRLDAAQYPNVTLKSNHLSFANFRALYIDAAVVVVTTHDTPNASGVTALLEAMAMGRPVIVSDNPALRDYLPPPDAGVVIPIGDSVALRTAIEDLLAHPDKAEAMGRQARVFVEQKFHPRSHFEAMAALFHEVMERHRKRNEASQ